MGIPLQPRLQRHDAGRREHVQRIINNGRRVSAARDYLSSGDVAAQSHGAHPRAGDIDRARRQARRRRALPQGAVATA